MKYKSVEYSIFLKKKWCALLWYICTEYFCLVKPQLRQQPAPLTCSPLASLQQQPIRNKQKHPLGQQHVWCRSEGRRPRAGDPLRSKKLVQITENPTASSYHKHSLKKDQPSKTHFQNGWVCSPSILTLSSELHTRTCIVQTALASDLALKYSIFPVLSKMVSVVVVTI